MKREFGGSFGFWIAGETGPALSVRMRPFAGGWQRNMELCLHLRPKRFSSGSVLEKCRSGNPPFRDGLPTDPLHEP
jgi:hypothetical protein